MKTLSLPDLKNARGESLGYGDLEVSASGNLVNVDGVVGLQQRVTQRLRFWAAEWFLDAKAGIPYVGEIFGDLTPVDLASAILADEVQAVDGVERISDIVTSYDAGERSLSWSCTVHGGGGSAQVEVSV